MPTNNYSVVCEFSHVDVNCNDVARFWAIISSMAMRNEWGRWRSQFFPPWHFFHLSLLRMREAILYRLYCPLCVSRRIDTWQIVFLSNKDPCPKISIHKSEIKVPVTNSPRFVVSMGCVWCMCEGRRDTIWRYEIVWHVFRTLSLSLVVEVTVREEE